MDVGVEEIARRAGVGKATFFRRFPTKEALVLAVYEGFIEEVEARSTSRCSRPSARSRRCARSWSTRCSTQAQNKAFFEAVAARFVPPVEHDRPHDGGASSA